jgi:spore coat polysaccharide biosynthesis protein SpsF (cytidylyltransferase family)
VKYLFIVLFVVCSLFSKGTDYSELSTQELLAIMGYEVKEKSNADLLKELKKRLGEMSPKEKEHYEKNLKKMR